MFRKTKFYLWELRVKIPKKYAVWFIPVFLSLGKKIEGVLLQINRFWRFFRRQQPRWKCFIFLQEHKSAEKPCKVVHICKVFSNCQLYTLRCSISSTITGFNTIELMHYIQCWLQLVLRVEDRSTLQVRPYFSLEIYLLNRISVTYIYFLLTSTGA